MPVKTDWNKALQPLLKKYKNKKHPLHHRNRYELMVMVVLSAQTTDNIVNSLSEKFFNAFPDMQSLAKADIEMLIPFISKVRGFRKKAGWLIQCAQLIKTNDNIPLTMEELVKLPGIGRKSANVIMREAHVEAAGVVVDLHVLRVAPRLGIAKGENAKDVEQQIMKKVKQVYWGEAGMAISFLGRETCRPTNPDHAHCVMNKVCAWYAKEKKIAKGK